MKKSKPSKQAGNLTKRESNKGDSKGIAILQMDARTQRPPTKEEIKRLVDRLKKSKSENIELDESFIDWLMSNRENLKWYLKNEIERLNWISAHIIPFIEGKKSKRVKPSPKKEIFKNWVKQKFPNEYSKLTLDDLHDEADKAFYGGELPVKIGRDTISKCLPDLRKK